jgi:hypothetical protein
MRYRIFVSYAREDLEIAQKIANHLKKLRIKVIWDQDLPGGRGFHEETKDYIAFSHVFILLYTINSKRAPWVHQEAGYALGVGVPVLPLYIGEPPDAGFVGHLHARPIGEDGKDLEKELTAGIINSVISDDQHKFKAIYELAMLPDERASALARKTLRAIDLGPSGRLRMSTVLTSFSIPDKPWNHPDWNAIEGKKKRSEQSRRILRDERRALEKYAKSCGCDLMIYPFIKLRESEPKAYKVRLCTLADCLSGLPPKKTRVVIKSQKMRNNLLILGDWFMAESLAIFPDQGVYQTMFTRHGPAVRVRAEEFDQEFQEELEHSKTDQRMSLSTALTEIQKIIDSIKD